MRNNNKNPFTIHKFGVICSIVQIIISVICLIYNIVTGENYILWIIFLCSGVCILLGNISGKNKN